MRRLWLVALFIGVGTSFSGGQQTGPSAPSAVAETKPAKVKIYTADQGVIAPELLPVNQTPIPKEKCKTKEKIAIPVSIYVDVEGVPRDLALVYPNESKLDDLALKTVATDRFQPGTYKGQPVPIAETVIVTLNACIDEKKSSSGQQIDQPWLCSLPEQKAFPLQKPEVEEDASLGAIKENEPGVIPPVPIHIPEAHFTEEALKAKVQGHAHLSIIVDVQGMPQNIHVIRPLGFGMDLKAIEAVQKYRFKPAMKDGKPVAVKINLDINFRLY